jgi:hypothetical protein
MLERRAIMRTLILSLAAAAATFAVASPASAQYYRQSYRGGYGYNNYGDVGGLQRRLGNVMRSLDGVRPDQANQLAREANYLERRLRIAGRNGLNPYEAHDLDVRIGQLERQLQYASRYSYGRYRGNGYNSYNGYNGYYRDRDRDGRDDRWEDDQGRDHDD